MSWLRGYQKRAKFSIKGSIIISDLTDFPVNIYLNENLFDVFTYTGQDYSKIAFTNDSGDRLYAEVVFWDSVNNKAHLYLKLPSITAEEDTVFYMYYATYISDYNYIGLVASLPAKQVWTNNFVAVYHMSEIIQPTGTFTEKTIYSTETTGTAAAGATAVANRTFTAVNVSGLTKENGVLKIRLKVNDPAYMDNDTSNCQLEIGSSSTVDINEWHYSMVKSSDPSGVLNTLSSTYKTFFIPLSYFNTSGGELNVSNIARIRWYCKAKTSSLTIYWKDAEIIRNMRMQDSTPNENHAFAVGNMSSSAVNNILLHKGTTFDGGNDRLQLESNPSLDLVNAITFESYFRILQDYYTSGAYSIIMSKGADSGSWRIWQTQIFSNGSKVFNSQVRKSSSDAGVSAGATYYWSVGNFYHLSTTYDKTYLKLYKDGEILGSPTAHSEDLVTSNVAMNIGCGWWNDSLTDYCNALVSEARVSSVARSESWVKATSASLHNSLVGFIGVENAITAVGCEYNDIIYNSTTSGIDIYENNILTTSLYLENTTSVWANDSYIFVGTTDSGINRYNRSTLSYVDNYKTPLDLGGDYVNYMHGNWDFLCATTSSGVCRINLTNDSVIKSSVAGVSKCFQTSTGEFYYIVNSEYATNFWSYARHIYLGDSVDYTQYSHALVMPAQYTLNKLLSGTSDVVFVEDNGSVISYDLYFSNGYAIYSLKLNSETIGVQMLYSKNNVIETKELNNDDFLSINFNQKYPSSIFRKDDTVLGNRHSYVKHIDDQLIAFFHEEDTTGYASLKGHYLYGDCFAELEFYLKTNDYGRVDFTLNNDAGYTVGLSFVSSTARYNIGSGWVNYNTESANNTIPYKLYIYVIGSTIFMRYNNPSGTIRTWTTSFSNFGSGPVYFKLYLGRSSQSSDKYMRVNSFKYKADSYYIPTNFSISEEHRASYSEVYKVSNINHDWSLEDATIFSSESIINKITIADRLNSSRVNDLYVTEQTSTHNANTLFLATNYGVTVIDENPTDYTNSNSKYYLLKS